MTLINNLMCVLLLSPFGVEDIALFELSVSGKRSICFLLVCRVVPLWDWNDGFKMPFLSVLGLRLVTVRVMTRAAAIQIGRYVHAFATPFEFWARP